MESLPFLKKTKAGLYFEPGDFYLDPKRAVVNAVISHGHADHAYPRNENAWCTPGTASIMRARYGDTMRTALHSNDFGNPFEINGVKVTFYPAGHILGSAQILFEHEGIRYCYTGDFKLRSDDSCEPMLPVCCDVLITETTFANPEYDHPDEIFEIEKLKNYTDVNLVIGAYSLGKAQRITMLLNKHLSDRELFVHHEAAVFHKIYEAAGFKLGRWSHFQRNFKQGSGQILIGPPKILSTFIRTPGIVTAFATGWKKPFIRSDHHIQISDHADWNEILNLIEQTGAQTILTVHGEGEPLKKHLEMRSNNIKVII